MAQTQFKSTDTDPWLYGFGTGSAGNGSINTSTDAPIDSACSGTSGTTSLTATNASFATGQLILIHQTRGTGAGAWELNRIASYSAGTITTSLALKNTYTNSGASVAQVIVMTEYNNLTINSGQTLTAKAWNGTVGGIIAKFVKGTCTVTGNITTTGKSFLSKPGGNYQNTTGFRGEGTAGAGWDASSSANGDGGGGGGGGTNQGNGGGGGHAAAGSNGSGGLTTNGTGGSAVGTASLVSLNFGGAGGTGGFKDSSSGTHVQQGIGGGIVLIISSSISVSGTISCLGTVGQNEITNHNTDGGGAGGSILIKTKTATLGTTLLTATGAAGGTGGNGSGGAGSVGRIHLDYKDSYTGTTNPTLDYTQDATLDYPPSSNFFAFFN